MKIQIHKEIKSNQETAESRPVTVELPDTLPDDMPFPVEVDGRKYTARWSRLTSSLGLVPEGTTVAWSIPVRSMRVTRFSGEAEASCDIECLLPQSTGTSVAASVKATAQRLLPGMGSGQRAAKGLRSPLLRSQITGKVLAIQVTEGAVVNEGDLLMVIEAMKMENRIVAPARVRIAAVKAKTGTSVSVGEELMRFEPVES